MKYRKLSFLISAYLLIAVLSFSASLLFWTYKTSKEAVNLEIDTLLKQQHAIFEIVFNQIVDKIENLLRDIQRDPVFTIQLQSDDQRIIQQALEKILATNDDYDLDLLFVSRLDGRVWIDASSAMFDTSEIVAEINRTDMDKKLMTGIRQFVSQGKSVTTIMLSVPLVHWDTGHLFGNVLGGYILNDNFTLMESIRSHTKSQAISMFANGNPLGSTAKIGSPLEKVLNQARRQAASGTIFIGEGYLSAYRTLVVSGAATSVEIATAIADNTSALLRRSFLQKAAATTILTVFFLVLTLYLIRLMTVPSLRRLINFTKELASGRLEVPFRQEYIHEFNQIGGAMVSMANRLNEADHQRRELEHIINLSPVVVLQWKDEDRWPVTFVSENVRQFGYSPEDFNSGGLFFKDIIHSDDLSLRTNQVFQYSKGSAREFVQEYRIVTMTGEVKWVEDRTWVQRDPKGRVAQYHGVIMDVTQRKKDEEERKTLEDQLTRSKKMEALGMLAGGVAHDLNNILSGIMSYPELMLMELDENDRLRKPLLTIMDSGQRAAAVVQDLLTIARGVASNKKIDSLNSIWKDFCQSPEYHELRSNFPGVEIKTMFASDLKMIRCSTVHIKKVMMNLLTNAMESIGDVGTVIVSTGNRTISKSIREYENFDPGDYSMLRFIDNGPGISQDDLERIFEPFYTKKEMGRSGTGLGLAVVWNTMLDHKGYINVVSNQNKTVFELFFPISIGVEEGIEGEIPIENLKGNSETVLVVDDEMSQQEIACGMLEMLGYSPSSVSSGEEAINYLGSHSVDVLLLDMLMPPGISGMETYHRIIQLHPGQKAVIASGFSESDDVRKTQNLGAGKYLKKPYTIKTLGLAIKRELERS